jgi:hypothetical protein
MDETDRLFTIAALADQLDLPRAIVDYWRKTEVLQAADTPYTGSKSLYAVRELQIGRFLKYFLSIKTNVKVLKLLARAFRSVLAQTCEVDLANMFVPALAAAKAGGTSFMGVQIDTSAKVELFASFKLDKIEEFIAARPLVVPTIIISLVEVMKAPKKQSRQRQPTSVAVSIR